MYPRSPVQATFPRRHPVPGFTLLEVLVCVGLVVVLLLMAAPAVRGLGSANQFNSQVATVSDLLENAQATALARNTYVWVGLENLPDRNAVALTAAYAQRGQATDLVRGELAPIGNPVVLENVRLAQVPLSDLPAPGRSTAGVVHLEAADLDPSTQADRLSTQIAGKSQSFTHVVQLSPSGEVRATASRAAWIEIGLVPSQSGSNQKAVLQVSGVTGRVMKFLP